MALIRWEPAAELNTLQTEMNRLFTSLFDTPTRAVGAAPTRRWVPAMDLVENEDHYVLHADLPGLSEQDIKIELDARVLTISGERRSERDDEQHGYRRIERSYGSFSRSLTLPAGVDGDAVAASFDKGVLEVRIPKPEQAKPRTIAVSANATAPAADTPGDATAEATTAGDATATA
jgi:HSP20 family protein